MAKTIADYNTLHIEYKAEPFSACNTIYTQWLSQVSRPKAKPKNKSECDTILYSIIKVLLDRREFRKAATLLWGSSQFNAEPYLVKRLWDEMEVADELLVLGAGSVGKSFNVGVYCLLDFWSDPLNTSFKVLSASFEHAKTNFFAHVQNLHRNAIIPMPGELMARSIRASEDDSQGFQLMALPKGADASGTLRGFHPKPRQDLHPLFGTLTRIRVVIDEAEAVAESAWEQVDNIRLTEEAGGNGRVKIFAMTNPKDRTSKFAMRCMPITAGGWNDIDVESSEVWKGQNNSTVLRLDGWKSENVQRQTQIYSGFMTYEGFIRFSPGTPEWWTMARGLFPPTALNISVISQEIMNRAMNSPLQWSGITIGLLAIDLAFEGKDRLMATYGRLGTARGHGKHLFKAPKKCLEVVQQFDLGKYDPEGKLTQSLYIAKAITDLAKSLGLKDHQVIVDATGAGTGIDDILKQNFGPNVMGINYSESATDKKLLAEDHEIASELYDRVFTELWFLTKRWMEFDYLKFAPTFVAPDLVTQLTSRRYLQKPSGKLQVESKKEYKSRGNDSPDKADSLTLLTFLARERSEEIQSIYEDSGGGFSLDRLRRIDRAEHHKYIDFNEDQSDEPEEKPHPIYRSLLGQEEFKIVNGDREYAFDDDYM